MRENCGHQVTDFNHALNNNHFLNTKSGPEP